MIGRDEELFVFQAVTEEADEGVLSADARRLPPSITSIERVNNSVSTIDSKAISELPRLAFLDLCAKAGCKGIHTALTALFLLGLDSAYLHR